MSQYILINRIRVQGANAVAGFTWGFPAITHFLGYSHNITRKLSKQNKFSDIQLSGCAVVAHQQNVHNYGRGAKQFLQSKKPAYLEKDVKKVMKGGSPSIIEEGKMDMELSLLIACDGNIGNRKEEFIQWLNNACVLQRLAGGTVLGIGNIDLYTVDDEQNRKNLRTLIRKLLPGFILFDRSTYLEQHFLELQKDNADVELFDAWLDFIALKQKARPKYDLIMKHFQSQADFNPESERDINRLALWQKHLEQPYEQQSIPDELKKYFSEVDVNNTNKKILAQWQSYCEPNEKTDAVWEYVDKPNQGFLVPIMTGYKAISKVYENHEVANTRDNETDVCFVEAVHSIGEWKGVHHIKDESALQQTLWHYHYEPNWYLCKQNIQHDQPLSGNEDIRYESPEDDFS